MRQSWWLGMARYFIGAVASSWLSHLVHISLPPELAAVLVALRYVLELVTIPAGVVVLIFGAWEALRTWWRQEALFDPASPQFDPSRFVYVPGYGEWEAVLPPQHASDDAGGVAVDPS
jgi:hypothetical protein